MLRAKYKGRAVALLPVPVPEHRDTTRLENEITEKLSTFSGLRHVNIIQTVGFTVDSNGAYYLVTPPPPSLLLSKLLLDSDKKLR